VIAVACHHYVVFSGRAPVLVLVSSLSVCTNTLGGSLSQYSAVTRSALLDDRCRLSVEWQVVQDGQSLLHIQPLRTTVIVLCSVHSWRGRGI